MGRPFTLIMFITCTMLSLLLESCSSVRYQQGFSYQPQFAGPDVASGQGDKKELPQTENSILLAVEYPKLTRHTTDESNNASFQVTIDDTRSTRYPSSENNSAFQNAVVEGHSPNPPLTTPDIAAETEILSGIISREYMEHQQSGQTLSSREKLRKMASVYAHSTNKELTGKQLRKLDRYAAKMEKKQKKHASDVNWGPSDNLEWFILLGAGVALVVGILGVGVGWFVFLGLALVYLYLKLLKNN